MRCVCGVSYFPYDLKEATCLSLKLFFLHLHCAVEQNFLSPVKAPETAFELSISTFTG